MRGVGRRNVVVPSSATGGELSALPAAGRRNTKVPGLGDSCGEFGAGPSWPGAWAGVSAGTLGSAPVLGSGAPQEIRRSWSALKPDWWARSAPQAAAGSGRLPCWASAGLTGAGSSSKKCGPVSSTDWPGAPGAASGRPSDGAGRLVPGTQAAPFQYRTYPGMDGSG